VTSFLRGASPPNKNPGSAPERKQFIHSGQRFIGPSELESLILIQIIPKERTLKNSIGLVTLLLNFMGLAVSFFFNSYVYLAVLILSQAVSVLISLLDQASLEGFISMNGV